MTGLSQAQSVKNTAPAKPVRPSVIRFALPKVDGAKNLQATDYKGDFLLVAFVSSGCSYCQKTLPQLEEAAQNIPGLQVVTAFLDSAPARPAALLKRLDLSLNAAYQAAPLAREWLVDGVPMLFLFGPDQQFIKLFDGYSPSRVTDLKNTLQAFNTTKKTTETK